MSLSESQYEAEQEYKKEMEAEIAIENQMIKAEAVMVSEGFDEASLPF